MTRARSYLDKLNKEQRAAVVCGIRPGEPRRKLPLLIHAGPGSGKTRTLAACIAYTAECDARTDRMMICSFTRKAASDLAARVRKLRRNNGGLPEAFPYAGTFHSIALKLLRRFGHHIGLRPDFVVLGKSDVVEFLVTLQARLELVRSFPRASECGSIFSYGRNAQISLRTTLERRYQRHRRFENELAELRAEYKAAKKKQNLVDYDDLLFHFSRLLRHPLAGTEIRRRIKFVFVDEFQDTSPLQWKIVRLLTPRGKGLTVVGDDAQAIYGFRAATVRNIRDFEERFKRGTCRITLSQNYRSTRRIVAMTNTVMKSASDNVCEKKLWSENESGPRPRLVAVPDESAQAKYVVKRARILRKKGVLFKNQGVLFRTSRDAVALEAELFRAGIPYVKWGGRSLLEKPHVRDFISLLRWYENPRSQFDAIRVFQKLPGIGKATAEELFQQIDPEDLKRSVRRILIPAKAKADWNCLVDIIGGSQGARKDWTKTVRSLKNWFLALTGSASNSFSGKKADIERFVASGETHRSGRGFLSSILVDPAEANQPDDDQLVLSTIHSAKGQEFDAVTILSVVEGCIPSNRIRSPESIDEERRVFYVGMTRARTYLELIVPQRLSRSNITVSHVQVKARSRFLGDKAIQQFRTIG